MTDTHDTTQNPVQEWLPVPDFEGRYEVSSTGKVRRIYFARRGPAPKETMHAPPNTRGYPQVLLQSEKGRRYFLVHSLVMVAFVGPRPEGLTVNHIDGDKTNNRLENLEYVTPAENSRHASRLGLLAFGERNARYTHPETTARGDRNGQRLHPERTARGDRHGSRTKPDRVPRGDRTGFRLHPERVCRGEANGNSTLTTEQVLDIRRRYAAGGIGQRALAREYGVSRPTIKAIVTGRSWKHLLP